MQLDHIFEDLEAQFDYQLKDAQSGSLVSECNFLRVRRLDGRISELVMPLVGEDFAAGMLLGANEFQLVRFPGIAQLEFQKLNQTGLPALRFVECGVGKFMQMLQLPLEIQWAAPGVPEICRGVVHEALDGLLIIQTLGRQWPAGVPISAIAEIRIGSVENFGADS